MDAITVEMNTETVARIRGAGLAGEVAGHITKPMNRVSVDPVVIPHDPPAANEIAAQTQVPAFVTARMRAIEARPLRGKPTLEQLGFLHMALQDKLGGRYATLVKVVRP
jgi:hypothetical protein